MRDRLKFSLLEMSKGTVLSDTEQILDRYGMHRLLLPGGTDEVSEHACIVLAIFH